MYIRVAQPTRKLGTLFHAANSLMHVPKRPPPTPPHSAAASALQPWPALLFAWPLCPKECWEDSKERENEHILLTVTQVW